MIPEQFKERMKIYLGDKEYLDFMNSFDNEHRYHALRINTLKAKAEEAVNGLTFLDKKVPWEDKGFYYDEGEPGKLPFHEAGLYYIQEPSAMAPVHYLEVSPGDKVLDLCAAPGGKTTQIAAAMNEEGILVTNEINRDRAKILSLNVERLGIKNALVLNEDSGHLADVFEGYFNKILVDAPCSGEGMFRKNDNAGDEWSPENVKNCAIRQREILDNASKMLLPGGRLVYSTCTFSADENEDTVVRFLFEHPDFHVKEVQLCGGMENARKSIISETLVKELSGIDAECFNKCSEEASLAVRLWPHKLEGEGHFLCVFERDGELVTGDSYVPGGRNIPAKPEQIKPFETFLNETLIFDKNAFELKRGRMKCHLGDGRILNGILFMFGEQLYLAPEEMPGINGLKVMRPGLHLGTIKKDRFEPSHALALYLKKEDVKLACDFSADSLEIKNYLNGQTIRYESPKGWVLITTDDYSIGWAKASGGMLKNHYPKGLRINY